MGAFRPKQEKKIGRWSVLTRKAVEWLIFCVALWDMFFGLVEFNFMKVQLSIVWAIIAVSLEEWWDY